MRKWMILSLISLIFFGSFTISSTFAQERERTQFQQLILKNPNYFGNIKESPIKPVKIFYLKTSYEELKCVGFNPQFDRLEAVVWIKQNFGYGGGVCSDGTPEYVRFYLSYDNGVTWEDQGMSSYRAFNIPGVKPLEYDVTLQINPSKKFCSIENLPKVRAILSWNNPPPANTPDFSPVWGNVKEANIQIEATKWFTFFDLFKDLKMKWPPNFESLVDLTQPFPTAKAKALNAAELQALYKDKGVPGHRFLFPEVEKLIAKPGLTEPMMAPGFKAIFPGLEINIGSIIDTLLLTSGNTKYEELKCVGLNPNLDLLEGILTVKLPNGYSGGLCSEGSQEYIAFWVDWSDGAGWTYVGTTSVNVHDLSSIPPEGLRYAAFLPIDLTNRRQPCEKGAKIARVRAILSWQAPPSPADPNYPPTWGNRLETVIHIMPGNVPPPGTHPPIIQTVGGMDVPNISSTGLANGPAASAGFTAEESPFGGEIIITGHIANPTDISNGADHLKYRVEVSNDGGITWSQRLTNTFSLGRVQFLSGWSFLPAVTQSVDPDDWYEYQEDLTNGPGNAMIFPSNNVLGRWQTGGLTGLWKIRIKVKNPYGIFPPFWTSNVVTVKLDDTPPAASITITSGGGPCADFLIGDPISGSYAVSDEHFGTLTLSILPALGGSFTSPAPLPPGPLMPLTRTYAGGVPTAGEAGSWSLNTTGMPRCGYIVYLGAWDRTIVNSGYVGRYNQAVVGLCLRVQ